MKYLLLAAFISLPAYAQKSNERPVLTQGEIHRASTNAVRHSATPDAFWRAWAAAFGSGVEELDDQSQTQADLRRQHCERTRRTDRRIRCD